MKIAALAILALGQVTVGQDDFSIGVAAANAREHCLALPGPALDAGSPVALITPTEPQRVYRATVVRPTANCTVLSKHDAPGPYYVLALEAAAESPPDLAVAVNGRPDVRVARGQVRLRLTDTLREVRVRSCASSEGLHLTVWSGTPLRSTRLWHAYWYLGFDVEPDCQPRDYREAANLPLQPASGTLGLFEAWESVRTDRVEMRPLGLSDRTLARPAWSQGRKMRMTPGGAR